MNCMFMKMSSPFFSHFYFVFTENVKIDLTGVIQMFTNTGTYLTAVVPFWL